MLFAVTAQHGGLVVPLAGFTHARSRHWAWLRCGDAVEVVGVELVLLAGDTLVLAAAAESMSVSTGETLVDLWSGTFVTAWGTCGSACVGRAVKSTITFTVACGH